MVLELEFKCSLCNADFYYKRYLQEHLIRKHGMKKKFEKIEDGIPCKYCNRLYASNKSLSVHLAKVHKIVKVTVPCQELNCDKKFRNVRALRTHLCSSHNFEGIDNCQNLKFEKHSDFLKWMKEEETNSSSKFVIRYTRKYEDHVFSAFGCNRSGIYKPKCDEEKRQLYSRGTMKLGFHCTAAISVQEFSSHVKVSYYEQHYKHEKSIQRIGRKLAGRKRKKSSKADPENEAFQHQINLDPGPVVSPKKKAVKKRCNVSQSKPAELRKQKAEHVQQMMHLITTLDEKEKEIAEQKDEIQELKASLAAAQELLKRVHWKFTDTES